MALTLEPIGATEDLGQRVDLFRIDRIELQGLKKVEKEENRDYGFYGMFKTDTTKKNYLVINTYPVKNKEQIEELIKNFQLEEETFGEDYPENCIGCNKITSIAKCCYNNNFSELGLGRSYCLECEIRYSQTEKKWLCAKLTPDNYFCENPLNISNKCDKTHSNTKPKITKIEDYSNKYPFKKYLELSK